MGIVNNLMGFVTPHSGADGAANSGGCSLLVTLGGSRRGCSAMGMAGNSCHLLWLCSPPREKAKQIISEKKKILERN